jgi:hypothetical protein
MALKDPMQQAVRDALIGFMAATAREWAEATKAAQREVSNTLSTAVSVLTGVQRRTEGSPMRV